MRIFRTKAVSRFLKRERIKDARLADAVALLERGLIEADLGGGLFKQRIAREGQGKRGGYRVFIGFRSKDRAIFLFGFAKSERDNIDDDELTTLREIAAMWLAATDAKLTRALQDKILIEITHAEETKRKIETNPGVARDSG